jgi:hypothetical protein
LREFGLAEFGRSSPAGRQFGEAFDLFATHGETLATPNDLKTLSLLGPWFMNGGDRTMARKRTAYNIEGVTRREQRRSPILLVLFGLIIFLMAGVMLSPIPEKIRRKLGLSDSSSAKVKEKIVKVPETKVVYQDRVVEKKVEVRPPYYQVKKGTDLAKTSRGFDYKYKVEERPGRLASGERKNNGTYEASLVFSVNRPEPAKQFDQLVEMTPELGKMFPDLKVMVEAAVVSPFYKNLYDNKKERLKKYANRFDRVLTKHNYFDCQTMLEMEHPQSKRKVFLMQADMDVVSDGSDGDRLAEMPDSIVNSAYYQPFTSYGWKKTGKVENPMIAGWKKMLEKAKERGDSSEVDRLKTGIEDMKRRSFLIAEYDPFVVIPVDILGDRESAWGPNVGDYVAVVYGKKIYPAIVGDGGPSFKVGEASLRMAREINSKASPYSRPVSEVSVTYLVFPRSSEERWKEPDYESWRNETAKLIDEIGGLGEGYELHQWKNTLPKKEEKPE